MPAKPRSFVAVVKATERSLRAARVEHVFVGALAVSAFGVPRTTTDVDVIVEYGEEDAPRMAESFRRQSFKVRMKDLRDARAEGAHCTVHDTLSAFHVDIAPAARPQTKDAIRHFVRVRWRGSMLPIAGPEHTIVMKLVYGSEQDIEDAMRIYQRNRPHLDLERMREFARARGVSANLRGLKRKARALGKRKPNRRRRD